MSEQEHPGKWMHIRAKVEIIEIAGLKVIRLYLLDKHVVNIYADDSATSIPFEEIKKFVEERMTL